MNMVEYMIPDKKLRSKYNLYYGAFVSPVPDDWSCYWDIVFHKITWLSGMCSLIPADFLIKTIDFRSQSDVEKAFNTYTYSEKYIWWLLEQMIKAEYYEGIVIIEREIARMGLNKVSNDKRFEL